MSFEPAVANQEQQPTMARFRCTRCGREQESKLAFSLTRCRNYGSHEIMANPSQPSDPRPYSADTYNTLFKSNSRRAASMKDFTHPDPLEEHSAHPPRGATAGSNRPATNLAATTGGFYQFAALIADAYLKDSRPARKPSHVDLPEALNERIAEPVPEPEEIETLKATISSGINRPACQESYAEFPMELDDEEDEEQNGGSPSGVPDEKINSFVSAVREAMVGVIADKGFDIDTAIYCSKRFEEFATSLRLNEGAGPQSPPDFGSVGAL